MMKRIGRVLRTVALVLVVLAALFAAGLWLYLNHGELTARRRIPEVERYAVSAGELVLPETARIVGLGEATHGNAEFQALKLSVFQRLVEDFGFRALALEADFGEGLMVNDYIQGGEGTAKEIVARLSFPIYHTDQMTELIEWMRAYNADAAPEDKLHFYGFDMQNTMESAKRVIAFCREREIEGVDEALEALQPLTDDDAPLNAEGALAIKQALGLLGEAITGRQTDSLDEAAGDALQATRTLAQAMGTFENGGEGYYDYRDSCMADNVQWIVSREEQLGHGKVMLAGHNGHIARRGNGVTPMGELLAERFGNEYAAIGTGFFTADVNISTSSMMTDTPERGIHRFCSADPLAYQARFMPEGMYALDFSSIPETSEVLYQLIREPMPMASIGEGYMWIWYLFPQTAYRPEGIPAELFDAMIYVSHAKPTEVWE